VDHDRVAQVWATIREHARLDGAPVTVRHVCVACSGAVAAMGVSLSLARGRGLSEPVCTTGPASEELAELQFTLGEGPCVDALSGLAPVLVADLSSASSGARWPLFAPTAAEAGFAAVHALPMRLRQEVIGGLNLFSTAPGILDADTVGLGQALANVATIGILHERTVRHGELIVEQLQTALNSRIAVEQAKGVLAERLQVTVADAFAQLRGHARRTNQRLVDLATAVVNGSTDVADIATTASPTGTDAADRPAAG
jgi:hypothetical protein